MSSALASAKRKRAVPESVTPQNVPNRGANLPGATASPSQPSGPLTIPQAFSMVERRLKALESFMEKSNGQSNSVDNSVVNPILEQQTQNIPDNIIDILDEYNVRFDILAEEISNLKNIVLSLQSYTMEVNKTLMEERIRVLSNNDETININYTIDELASDAKEITLEEALAAENL